MSGLDEAPPTEARPPPVPQTTRGDVLATLAIVGIAGAIAAWDPLVRRVSDHPSEQECAALLDRYVEHIAYAVEPGPPASAIASRKALARAALDERGPAAFARCEGELTRNELDCAMKAPSADTFERCLP